MRIYEGYFDEVEAGEIEIDSTSSNKHINNIFGYEHYIALQIRGVYYDESTRPKFDLVCKRISQYLDMFDNITAHSEAYVMEDCNWGGTPKFVEYGYAEPYIFFGFNGVFKNTKTVYYFYTRLSSIVSKNNDILKIQSQSLVTWKEWYSPVKSLSTLYIEILEKGCAKIDYIIDYMKELCPTFSFGVLMKLLGRYDITFGMPKNYVIDKIKPAKNYKTTFIEQKQINLKDISKDNFMKLANPVFFDVTGTKEIKMFGSEHRKSVYEFFEKRFKLNVNMIFDVYSFSRGSNFGIGIVMTMCESYSPNNCEIRIPVSVFCYQPMKKNDTIVKFVNLYCNVVKPLLIIGCSLDEIMNLGAVKLIISNDFDRQTDYVHSEMERFSNDIKSNK